MGESLITRRGGGGLGNYEWIKAFAPWHDTLLLEGYRKSTHTASSQIHLYKNAWVKLATYSSQGLPNDNSGKYEDVVAVVLCAQHLTFISGVQNEVETYIDTYPAKFKIATTYHSNSNGGYSTVGLWAYSYDTELYTSEASYIIYAKPSE